MAAASAAMSGFSCPPAFALSSGDDFDDFETVAGGQEAAAELGRGDGFAVVFDDDAARGELVVN